MGWGKTAAARSDRTQTRTGTCGTMVVIYLKGTLTTRERQCWGRNHRLRSDWSVKAQGHRAKLRWGMNPPVPNFKVHILSHMLHCRDFSCNTKETKV